MGFDFEGTYEEIEPHKSSMLVLDDGRRSRTTFTGSSGKTHVATTFDAEAQNGEAGRCGWIVDRFGVSWQIEPKRMPDLLASEDPGVVSRVSEAMMQMEKIDLAGLEAAAAKEPTHGRGDTDRLCLWLDQP